MRILGFSKKWDKLQQPEFTTFRYPRKDKDWQVNERVQIVYKPRSKEREILGIVEIVKKEKRELSTHVWFVVLIPPTTDDEAISDGFASRKDMAVFFEKQYGRDYETLFNKLTLRWINEYR